MLDMQNPIPYIIFLLVAMLAYLLVDAHKNIKINLKEKATQKSLDDTKTELRADIHEMQKRHERETARLEYLYEQKFAAVVTQFQNRMDSVERNLQDRMDLILKLLKEKAP